MKERKRRTAAVLRSLYTEVESLGQLYVLVEVAQKTRSLLPAEEAHVLEPIQLAGWSALIIGIAGLFSTDQESITVSYLLDLASNHPYDFTHLAPEQVGNAVEKSRREIESVADLVDRIRTIRDRRLAHLDRKHVNEPQTMNDVKLGLEEAGVALKVAEKIIRQFSEAFNLELGDFDQSQADYRLALSRLLSVSDDQGCRA
jgi:hypothetical protein